MTTLDTLGELGLIDRIRKETPTAVQPGTIRGIGDDAAVFALSDTQLGLLSTDMLLEGIHFDLTYVPLRHLGFKAVAVNVSDIAAMNGLPTQITVSLGLSSRFTVEAVDELYAGIRAACEAYNIDLVGGILRRHDLASLFQYQCWGRSIRIGSPIGIRPVPMT